MGRYLLKSSNLAHPNGHFDIFNSPYFHPSIIFTHCLKIFAINCQQTAWHSCWSETKKKILSFPPKSVPPLSTLQHSMSCSYIIHHDIFRGSIRISCHETIPFIPICYHSIIESVKFRRRYLTSTQPKTLHISAVTGIPRNSPMTLLDSYQKIEKHKILTGKA